jgi:hypothetical protein
MQQHRLAQKSAHRNAEKPSGRWEPERGGDLDGGLATEWEFELAGNIGPEFAQDVVPHVVEDAEAHAAGSRSDAAVVVGVIGITDDCRGSRSEPLGVGEVGRSVPLICSGEKVLCSWQGENYS